MSTKIKAKKRKITKDKPLSPRQVLNKILRKYNIGQEINLKDCDLLEVSQDGMPQFTLYEPYRFKVSLMTKEGLRIDITNY